MSRKLLCQESSCARLMWCMLLQRGCVGRWDSGPAAALREEFKLERIGRDVDRGQSSLRHPAAHSSTYRRNGTGATGTIRPLPRYTSCGSILLQVFPRSLLTGISQQSSHYDISLIHARRSVKELQALVSVCCGQP